MTNLGNRDFDIWMAEQIILDTYGDTVSVAEKKKTLLKFGRRSDVNATNYRTLWNEPGTADHEVFVTTNAITHFASGSGSDTGDMVVEGHTVSGTGSSAEFTFVVQTVTLAGQTKTALTTPLARCSRVYNPTDTEWVGRIGVAEDVTFTSGIPAAVGTHMNIPAGNQGSQKAATTISNSDYWIITAVAGSILQKTSEFADLKLEVREVGGVFREKFNFAVSSSGGPTERFDVKPPVIVPKNADVRMVALAGSTNTIVTGWMNGYLASVQ